MNRRKKERKKEVKTLRFILFANELKNVPKNIRKVRIIKKCFLLNLLFASSVVVMMMNINSVCSLTSFYRNCSLTCILRL